MKKTVPYITGDGVGAEITPAMQAIVNAAVKKAYGNEHEIEWMEVLAGERAFNETGSWLPDETMEAFKKYGVGIKGPLTTPVGGGIRSLNVALRQTLDLYVCLRPAPSPKQPPSVKRVEAFAYTAAASTPARNSSIASAPACVASSATMHSECPVP